MKGSDDVVCLFNQTWHCGPNLHIHSTEKTSCQNPQHKCQQKWKFEIPIHGRHRRWDRKEGKERETIRGKQLTPRLTWLCSGKVEPCKLKYSRVVHSFVHIRVRIVSFDWNISQAGKTCLLFYWWRPLFIHFWYCHIYVMACMSMFYLRLLCLFDIIY